MRNAVEAMETSEKRELLVATDGPAGGSVEITIADTGPGISPEIAARLFEPFQTTKSAGMGVGLSICREIVEAHGGRIAVVPNVSNGTVFIVTLPNSSDEEKIDDC